MKQWFAALTPREQRYLLAMVMTVSLWLLYQLALAPANAQRQQMLINNRAAAALLARVDTKVAQLKSLRSEASQGTDSNLTATITRISQLSDLTVRRMQPNSRGEVQVRFESVDYDGLVQWLHRIEVGEGLVVVDASIAQAGRSGGVNATVRVAKAG